MARKNDTSECVRVQVMKYVCFSDSIANCKSTRNSQFVLLCRCPPYFVSEVESFYELWKVVDVLMMSLRSVLVLQFLILKYSANLSP